MSKKQPPDPPALLARAKALREEADALEADAIRAALERSEWLVARAAALLGYPRTSSLQRLLETRHAALGEEARERRAKAGYSTGRPKSRE